MISGVEICGVYQRKVAFDLSILSDNSIVSIVFQTDEYVSKRGFLIYWSLQGKYQCEEILLQVLKLASIKKVVKLLAPNDEFYILFTLLIFYFILATICLELKILYYMLALCIW